MDDNKVHGLVLQWLSERGYSLTLAALKEVKGLGFRLEMSGVGVGPILFTRGNGYRGSGILSISGYRSRGNVCHTIKYLAGEWKCPRDAGDRWAALLYSL